MLFLTALLAAIFVLAHTAPFPFLLDAASRERAAWSLPARGKTPTVYLTYDDGPNPAATPELLDALAHQRVRATFFLIDRWVGEDTAPIIARMFAEGHGVALHSDDRWLMTRSPARIAETLTAAADRIEALTGRRPCRAFRPHAGWRSSMMFTGLQRIDHRLVGWGWFAWDWNGFRARTAEGIVRRVMARAADGVIVVIHDGHHRKPRAARAYAIDATERLVPALRARGFTFGTVCDALGAWESSPHAADQAR